jgi:hypothetical protein
MDYELGGVITEAFDLLISFPVRARSHAGFFDNRSLALWWVEFRLEDFGAWSNLEDVRFID